MSIGIVFERPFGVDWVNTCERSPVLFRSLGVSSIIPGALRGAQEHQSVKNFFRGYIYFKSKLLVFKLSKLLAAIGCMYERTLLGRLALCLRIPFGVDRVNTCERSPVLFR